MICYDSSFSQMKSSDESDKIYDSLAIEIAVRTLSPVAMMQLMSASCNSFIVSGVPGFIRFDITMKPKKVRSFSASSLLREGCYTYFVAIDITLNPYFV